MIKGDLVTGNGALSSRQLDLGSNDGVCVCDTVCAPQFGHNSKGVLQKNWYLAREVERVLRFEARCVWELWLL